MGIYEHDVENLLDSISQADTAQERSFPPDVGSNDSGKWSLLSMHDEPTGDLNSGDTTHSQFMEPAIPTQPLGKTADVPLPELTSRDVFQCASDRLPMTPALPVASNRDWVGENHPQAVDQQRIFNPEPVVAQKSTSLRDAFQRIVRPNNEHKPHESGSRLGSGSLFSRFKR